MDTIPPFRLERYFAQYEFKARYLLSASDCESLTMRELLDLADPDSLRRWHSLSLGYTESQGLPALREEVAALYPGIAPDDVLILSPEEGIYIAMFDVPGSYFRLGLGRRNFCEALAEVQAWLHSDAAKVYY